jgi:hypothetical protein
LRAWWFGNGGYHFGAHFGLVSRQNFSTQSTRFAFSMRQTVRSIIYLCIFDFNYSCESFSPRVLFGFNALRICLSYACAVRVFFFYSFFSEVGMCTLH